jgi:hypothetical protein
VTPLSGLSPTGRLGSRWKPWAWDKGPRVLSFPRIRFSLERLLKVPQRMLAIAAGSAGDALETFNSESMSWGDSVRARNQDLEARTCPQSETDGSFDRLFAI